MRNYKNERTIVASNRVTADFVLESLKEVRNEPAISSVTVQDMLIGCHCKLPLVNRALAAAFWDTSCPWSFEDSVPLARFHSWQAHSDRLRTTIMDRAKQSRRTRVPIFTTQANVQIAKGTSEREIRHFLAMLLRDASIYNVSFSGALYGYYAPHVPKELCRLMELDTQGSSSWQLQEDITIGVSCGHEEDEDEFHWRKIVQECVTALEKLLLLSPTRSSGLATKKQGMTRSNQTTPLAKIPKEQGSLQVPKAA